MKVKDSKQMDKMSGSSAKFLKLQEGTNKVRVVSDIHVVREHRSNIKKLSFTVCPTEMARLAVEFGESQDSTPLPCPLCEKGYPVNTKYLATAILRNTKGEDEIGILKASKTVLGSIMDIDEDEDFEGTYRNFDFNIRGKGEGKQRRYTVQCIPNKKVEDKDITDDEKEKVMTFGPETLDRMTTALEYEKIVNKVLQEDDGSADDIPDYDKDTEDF